jgi:hypothetical protein
VLIRTVCFSSILCLCAAIVPASQSPKDLPLIARCDFKDGSAAGWQPKDPSHWRVISKDGSMVYELTAPGEPGPVRAPTSWSLLAGPIVTSFVFAGRLQCYTDPENTKRDMCVVFHFQDPTHFYYVHFSASSDDVHNIVGLVNGADRVKINAEGPGQSAVRLTDKSWHDFRVTYDEATGEIRAYMDDLKTPILNARDTTLRSGRIGVGSFDDTGCFDDLTLWGKTSR